MIPVNFNHLYYFWVIAKEGSFSAAQKRLFLTQSALSLQIQRLERALGKKLLDRGRHGASLTPDGKLAFEHCERMFPATEDLLERWRTGRPPSPPALKLGMTGTISREILLRILEFVRRASPENRVHVFSGQTEDLQNRLARRTVDLVVSDVDFSPGMGPDFRSRLVARLPLFFVASPRVRDKVRRFPRDLARVPLLLRGPENPLRKEVDHFLYEKKISPPIEAELEDADFLLTLLLQGRGAAVLDSVTLETFLRRRQLAKLHRKPLSLRQNIWFVYRRHHREEPALQRAMDILMDTFEFPGRRAPS